MARDTNQQPNVLAAEIRRNFRDEAMRRYVQTLPAFATEDEVPDRFQRLLSEIDSADSKAQRKHHG